MKRLPYTDHAEDPAAWARALGCSQEACELLLASDFVDLHSDLEIPVRLLGWRPEVHHGVASWTRPLMLHTDYPRLREGSFTGVVYDITTNPFRPAKARLQTTLRNVEAAIARVRAWPQDLALVTDHAGYLAARAQGLLAMWISFQGANAVSADLSVLSGPLGQQLHRITVVHLTTSDLGGTNSPMGWDQGLTASGRELVERCNEARILVDLAHAGERTFWGIIEAHSPELPPIVSHTGVSGVQPKWRNVNDDQIRAVAARGGIIGIMYQSNFLAPVWFSCSRAAILDHMQHVIDLVGEDFVGIGTDYDGAITPPHDLTDPTHHPLLVQDMLDRGWRPERILKVLGGNYLSVVRRIRPGV